MGELSIKQTDANMWVMCAGPHLNDVSYDCMPEDKQVITAPSGLSQGTPLHTKHVISTADLHISTHKHTRIFITSVLENRFWGCVSYLSDKGPSVMWFIYYKQRHVWPRGLFLFLVPFTLVSAFFHMNLTWSLWVEKNDTVFPFSRKVVLYAWMQF